MFTVRRLVQLVSEDMLFLFGTKHRIARMAISALALMLYIKHFLPIVRYLRTKMLRNLCSLWMLFEQEEKMRTAYNFNFGMKVRQVAKKEIPITIKLMIFMWVLRKFVSVGAKNLLHAAVYVYDRYINAKEMRFIRDNNPRSQQVRRMQRLLNQV